MMGDGTGMGLGSSAPLGLASIHSWTKFTGPPPLRSAKTRPCPGGGVGSLAEAPADCAGGARGLREPGPVHGAVEGGSDGGVAGLAGEVATAPAQRLEEDDSRGQTHLRAVLIKGILN